MMKRLFFLLTALLTLSVGMWAQTPYIDENGVAQTVYSVNVITSSTTTLSAGWYVVTGSNVQTGSLTCNGEVHLILADGAKLSVAGGDYQAGIQVSGEGNSLSIYGQAAQSGRLIATGGSWAAGIGGRKSGSGSNITINGGDVTATGGEYAAGIGGGAYRSGSDITINGGRVTATGGVYAAGIGGGNLSIGSDITINGGMATATGGVSAAGIGGGRYSFGSNITINSGTVTATGKDFAAGIGGGNRGSGSNITIYGGDVTASGGVSAAGIGGGMYSSGSNITIKGGTVTATGGENGSGIGGGEDGSGSNITINSGTVTATGGEYAAGIGGGNQGDGSNITINGGMVTATGGVYAAGIGGGYGGSGSVIFMPVNYRIKADGSFIHNNGTDLAGSLAGKQNVEAYPDGLLNERNAAFAAISAAVEGIADEAIHAMADAAKEAVFQAEGSGDIEASKQKALDDLQYVISFYNSGKAAGKAEGIEEGKAEALGTMGESCEDCPAIDVKRGTTTIRLYSPEKVEFRKME